MPCHADWLNDLSLMPPVSVTMHPRNLPVVAAVAVLDAPVVAGVLAELEAGVLAAGVLAAGVLAAGVLLTLDELLPQAASSRVAAPATAAVINAVCFTVSSQWIRLPVPGHDGHPAAQIARRIFRRCVRWEEARRTAAGSLRNRDRKPRGSQEIRGFGVDRAPRG
jgi:hypothetical protein